MKKILKPGVQYTHKFIIPESKTVPSLYPESTEFSQMPDVFDTGFVVGFLEWISILCVNPYLDCTREQTVATHIDASHQAATPPGSQ